MSLVASSEISPMDSAVLALLPHVSAPVDAPFAPITYGRRLLLASNGLYIEAASNALYLRLSLCRFAPGFELPYGAISEAVSLPHGPLPRDYWDALVAASLSAHPNEMARLIVVQHDRYTFLAPEEHSAGQGHVQFDDHGYSEGSLLIDAHSHGVYGEEFSATDDVSDRSRFGPHLSIVFGRCASEQTLRVSARACIGQFLIDLPLVTLRGLFA